jgi:hypothetical protein
MTKPTETVKIFRYIEELDAFVVTDEYNTLATTLGLVEWTPVVWIGRLFTMDNDFGEHWFDNWDLREERQEKAEKMGLDENELLIINPDRFKDGRDGPCHGPEQRKRFWTDVLCSLELSYELLFNEARDANEQIKEILPDDYIADLESRIERIRAERTKSNS